MVAKYLLYTMTDARSNNDVVEEITREDDTRYVNRAKAPERDLFISERARALLTQSRIQTESLTEVVIGNAKVGAYEIHRLPRRTVPAMVMSMC